jgi:hypothetical protein
MVCPCERALTARARKEVEPDALDCSRSAKRGILEWIQNAKRPETRAARIDETARLANVNERANQWRKSGLMPVLLRRLYCGALCTVMCAATHIQRPSERFTQTSV